MKVLIITFFFFLAACEVSQGQNKKTLTTDEVSQHIENGLQRYYRPDRGDLNKFCRKGCLFIRFGVDPLSKIVDKAFSKDSAEIIVTALSIALDSLKNDKILMYTLQKLKTPVLIPFIYDYQLGCNVPPVNLRGTKEQGVQRTIKYYSIMDDMDHLHETLFNMLQFQHTELKAIKCLLLQPVRVGAFKENL